MSKSSSFTRFKTKKPVFFDHIHFGQKIGEKITLINIIRKMNDARCKIVAQESLPMLKLNKCICLKI